MVRAYRMEKSHLSLSLRLTVYFGVVVLVGWALLSLFPGFATFLPIGGADKLFEGVNSELLQTVQEGRLRETDLPSRVVFLFLSVGGTLIFMVPISWVYLGTNRAPKETPSIVQTMMLLPITVTGLVMIVQNSLALSFSLAGLVAGAGIRFRSTMRDVSNSVYFLAALGVGLSSGIGALGVSGVMSICFCYTALIIRTLNYGAAKLESEGGSDSPVA